jgi:hypothetical protein
MYLPNEILNIIFSYRGKHPLSIIVKNIITNYYELDSNPYEITHKCCYSYSFQYWYFNIIRKEYNKLKWLTPSKIPIGPEKLNRNFYKPYIL